MRNLSGFVELIKIPTLTSLTINLTNNFLDDISDLATEISKLTNLTNLSLTFS